VPGVFLARQLAHPVPPGAGIPPARAFRTRPSDKENIILRINYPAVFVSALAYWLLGAVWYSPLPFARPFLALSRWTPEQIAAMQAAGEGKQIAVALVTSLLLAYVLAHFVRFTGAETVRSGLLTGFWVWLGFVATTNLETVLFEGRPLGLYLINDGYHLVGLLGMGATLAVWRRRDLRLPAYQS
jgi:hypothetical protein